MPSITYILKEKFSLKKIKKFSQDTLLFLSMAVCAFPIMFGPFFAACICAQKKEKGYALISDFIEFFSNATITDWFPWIIIIYQFCFLLLCLIIYYDEIKGIQKAKGGELTDFENGKIFDEANWSFSMGFAALFLLFVPLFIIAPILYMADKLIEAIAIVFSESTDETIASLSALPQILKDFGILAFFILYDFFIGLIGLAINGATVTYIGHKTEIETLKKKLQGACQTSDNPNSKVV